MAEWAGLRSMMVRCGVVRKEEPMGSRQDGGSKRRTREKD